MNIQHDLVNSVKAVVALPAQTINSNTTTAGSSIDLKGYNAALIVIHTGTISGSSSANIYTPLIEESDDNSSFTAVADADLINTEAAAAKNGGDDNETAKIGYKGTKRYIKVSIVSTAFTTAGGIVGAVALLHGAQVQETPA